jgi:hypothetical protein
METLTSYPGYDGPFLASYDGAYDMAFAALHPFYTIPGHRPEDFAPWTLHIERSELEKGLSGSQLLAATDEVARDRRDGKLDPALLDALAKQSGCRIGWERLGRDAGFSTLGAVNRALCTGIGGLRAEFSDPAGATRLERYCSDKALFMPSEGRFQALMQHSIAYLLYRAGVDAVEAAAEFDEVGQLLHPGALAGDSPWTAEAGVPGCTSRLFAADRSVLVVVDWDSFFTLICGRTERLERVPMTDLFDGFWCSATTSHSWWGD